ncbi:MAG: hypothetical protein IRZ28_00710 [Steroidobacteraceae bacterium]|nr:hypothetical protein [Steroidobacteraceae bacterium]
MRQFLWGALSMACLTVSVFFLRYWKTTGDRLFVYFSTAFAILTLNWVGLAIVEPSVETRHILYVLRLAAFVLIIIGVLDKNRRGRVS